MPIIFKSAGESHGKGLVGLLEGVPSGLALSAADDVNPELKRRQGGYGRGGRMKIESDAVEFLSGVRWGRTLGGPLALFIENRDWKNWGEGMSAEAAHEGSIDPVTRPRPGHADLVGAMKYGHRDVRNVLERSSARETAMRVAAGAVCKKLLAGFGIKIGSFVTEVGDVSFAPGAAEALDGLHARAEASEMRCPDADATARMKALVDRAIKEGDSLGGIFTVFATGVPAGLGSFVQWDRKLDARLVHALVSIQAIKGAEVGQGFNAGRSFGSEVMDEIDPSAKGLDHLPPKLRRSSNNAGGIEGGMSNGMPIVLRAVMKPIPTLRRPLKSIDINTGEPIEAAYERSDTCAIAAASVVGEAMVAIALAGAFMEKFGGDSMDELGRNVASYKEYLKGF